jgi:hypothetical protein
MVNVIIKIIKLVKVPFPTEGLLNGKGSSDKVMVNHFTHDPMSFV